MKNLSRKFRIPEDSAPAVFFTLTLWLVGTYLALLLGFSPYEAERLEPPHVLLFLAFGSGLTGVFWLLAALRCFGGIFSAGKPLSLLRAFFFGLLALGWIGALWALGYAGYPLALLWTAAIYPVTVLPAFGLGKAGRGGIIAYAVSVAGWLGGIWLFQVIYEHCQQFRLVHYFMCEGLSVVETIRFQFVSRWLGLAGDGWGVILVLALLLIATGYFGSAAYLARLAGIPGKRLFTPGVRTLWEFAGVAWVLSAVMALIAQSGSDKIEAELARRFGKPLTVAALADFCREGRTPDPVFWKKIWQTWRCLDPGSLELLPEKDLRFIVTSPETRKMLLQPDRPNWQALVEIFASSPLPARGVPREEAIHLRPLENYAAARIAQIGTFAIEQALDDHQTAAALRIVGALRNADMIRFRPVNWLDAGDFIRFETARLNWLERLLESGQLSAGQTAALAAELDIDAMQLGEFKQNVLYMKAVTYLHTRRRGDDGLYITSGQRPPFSPFPTRLFGYLLPSLRWREYQDRQVMLKVISDFNSSAPQRNPNLIYLAEMREDIRAYELRCRLLSLLFRQYPARELPPELSLPPGVHARTGDCEIIESAIEPDPTSSDGYHNFKRAMRRKTIPALQLWSDGPDHENENGLGDDVRVIMRIKP